LVLFTRLYREDTILTNCQESEGIQYKNFKPLEIWITFPQATAEEGHFVIFTEKEILNFA
jgi:hypothetical protein